jgi:hypothetical protein
LAPRYALAGLPGKKCRIENTMIETMIKTTRACALRQNTNLFTVQIPPRSTTKPP